MSSSGSASKELRSLGRANGIADSLQKGLTFGHITAKANAVTILRPMVCLRNRCRPLVARNRFTKSLSVKCSLMLKAGPR